jgi:hypothetical protein
VGDVLTAIADLLKNEVIDPLLTEPQFRAGFWSCFVCLVVTGVVLWFVLWCRKLISAVFNPTKLPATNNGPSPFQSFVSCAVVIAPVMLTIIVIVIWITLSRLV